MLKTAKKAKAGQTDRQTDRRTDGPTKWLIESRCTRLKNELLTAETAWKLPELTRRNDHSLVWQLLIKRIIPCIRAGWENGKLEKKSSRISVIFVTVLKNKFRTIIRFCRWHSGGVVLEFHFPSSLLVPVFAFQYSTVFLLLSQKISNGIYCGILHHWQKGSGHWYVLVGLI